MRGQTNRYDQAYRLQARRENLPFQVTIFLIVTEALAAAKTSMTYAINLT